MAVRKGQKVEQGTHAKSRSTRYKIGVPCRCRKCWKRKTLPHAPDWYSVNSKIPLCCGRLMFRDHYRATGAEGNSKEKCSCDGYPFSTSKGGTKEWQHRKGSLFCLNGGKAITAGFTWQDRGSPEFRSWDEAGRPATTAGEAFVLAHNAMAEAIPASLSEEDYRLLDDAGF